MKFYFNQFAKQIHELYPDDFNLDEVKGILYLEDDGYKKSTPNSSGMRLLLQHIVIEGVKGDADIFRYDRILHSGVNIWIADNFKGKSSVFKAIKFALTGKNDFTPQVKSWIQKILLEFSIGTNIYTIELDTSAALKAKVYHCKISEITDKIEPLASLSGKENFSEYMQTLFFSQFNYFPIKKVQANQSVIGLVDADLTWSTYYHSIYQQSKDYGSLSIGSNNSAVFQMLLGLEFTYSIYALESKFKKLERELKIQNEKSSAVANQSLNIDGLLAELTDVDTQITSLKVSSHKSKVKATQENLNELLSAYESSRKSKLEIENEIYNVKNNLLTIHGKIAEFQREVSQYKRDVAKLKKQNLEYREYIDSGIFFNNLWVTECPHCNHEVDKQKFDKEKENKICMLCDHEISGESQDTSIWESKIIDNEIEINRYDELKQKVEQNIDLLQRQHDGLETSLQKLLLEGGELSGSLLSQLKVIGETEHQLELLINITNTDYIASFERLVERKISLERDIAIQRKQQENSSDSKLLKKVELMKSAHELLLKKRADIGQQILEELQEFMLKQLHSLGLRSYTAVEINRENFTIYYYQGQIKNQFNDISEGEQLRAKLALYLSLIELDLRKGLGRHPRLIVLDSPTKEEGDHHFIDGLKESLLHIEENFGTDVQILVGTANRELQNVITNPEKVEYREKDLPIF